MMELVMTRVGSAAEKEWRRRQRPGAGWHGHVFVAMSENTSASPDMATKTRPCHPGSGRTEPGGRGRAVSRRRRR